METRLVLLGQFSLTTDGRPLPVDNVSARIVSALGIYGSMERGRLAEMLWPAACRDRALANVRAALWRMSTKAKQLVQPTCHRLQLRSDVNVDLHELGHQAVVDPAVASATGRPAASQWDMQRLSAPLLSGWYDDWVVDEREKVRRRQVEILEQRARAHLTRNEGWAAIIAATWAVTIDPLREETHRLVLLGHLAEGNPGEAIAYFRYLEHLFDKELGVSPRPETKQVLAPCFQ